MAGSITVSTISNDTGVFAAQNAVTGIAKAWCYYNGITQTVINSFNISSVTYNSTGNYTFNFTTAMPNANYVLVSGAQPSGSADYITSVNNYDGATRTTSAVQVVSKWTNFATSATENWNGINIAILSS